MSRRQAQAYLLSRGISIQELERRRRDLEAKTKRLRQHEAAYWEEEEKRVKAAEDVAKAAEDYERAKVRYYHVMRRIPKR